MSVETQIATLEEQVKNTDKKIDRVDNITQRIWGVLDGANGVVTQASKNKDSIQELKDAHVWWRRLIIGTSVSGVLGGAIGLIWWTLR